MKKDYTEELKKKYGKAAKECNFFINCSGMGWDDKIFMTPKEEEVYALCRLTGLRVHSECIGNRCIFMRLLL